ncbi:heterokaryon incompatibility protein [Coniochaeta sp. 2T2.1]|nr:heterokaryon incompatibility protein [Coniochaeta sp. 2T2.1]
MDTVSTSVHSLSATGSAQVHVGNNIYSPGNNCLEALRITDPSLDKKRIEADKGGLLNDVYQWVLSNCEFLRWRHDAQNKLRWIQGDPGKGKTMLLCGIINELEKDSGALSYFFCQAIDRRINNATAVLRGLIYMLVDRQPSLLSHVQKRYERAGRQLFEDVNAWFAVRDIFVDILRDPGPQSPYLVIDRLDECQTGRSELLDLIVSSSTTSRAKWILSSRNWHDIEEKLAQDGQKVPLSLELNKTLGVSRGSAVSTAFVDHFRATRR